MLYFQLIALLFLLGTSTNESFQDTCEDMKFIDMINFNRISADKMFFCIFRN